MTEASKGEHLVERLVVGPKPIHYHDPKTGERKLGNIGDTIRLPARSAKAFSRYLISPEVAAARAKAEAAEAAEAAEEIVSESDSKSESESESKDTSPESAAGDKKSATDAPKAKADTPKAGAANLSAGGGSSGS